MRRGRLRLCTSRQWIRSHSWVVCCPRQWPDHVRSRNAEGQPRRVRVRWVWIWTAQSKFTNVSAVQILLRAVQSDRRPAKVWQWVPVCLPFIPDSTAIPVFLFHNHSCFLLCSPAILVFLLLQRARCNGPLLRVYGGQRTPGRRFGATVSCMHMHICML